MSHSRHTMKTLAIIMTIVLGVAPLGAAVPEDDVMQMLVDFYNWYVPYVQNNGKMSDERMSPYVTDRLRARIAKLSKAKDGEIADLDYDPFLNAQDIANDWARNIKIHDVKVKGESAIATVDLKGEFDSTIHLQLLRDRGKWKIDNFTPKI